MAGHLLTFLAPQGGGGSSLPRSVWRPRDFNFTNTFYWLCLGDELISKDEEFVANAYEL